MEPTQQQYEAIQATGTRPEEWAPVPFGFGSGRAHRELRRVTFKADRMTVQIMSGSGEIEGDSYLLTEREHVEGYTYGVEIMSKSGARLEIGGFRTKALAVAFANTWKGTPLAMLSSFPGAEWMDGGDNEADTYTAESGLVDSAIVYTYAVISGTVASEDVY